MTPADLTLPLADLPVDELATRFAAAGGFLHLPGLVDVAPLAAGLPALAPRVRRTDLPMVATLGMVPSHVLAEHAPALIGVYASPALRALLQGLIGRPVHLRHHGLEHACALYWYGEPDDGMAPHFDDCGAPPGVNYTVLLGLANQSSQRLYYAAAGQPEGWLELRPGDLVVFCGSRFRHRVTPLAPGEHRILLSMRYTIGASPPPTWRARARARLARHGLSWDDFASTHAFGSQLSLGARLNLGFSWGQDPTLQPQGIISKLRANAAALWITHGGVRRQWQWGRRLWS